MSSNVLTKYKDQYGNVYEKGALIGMCLDIRLRQLSNGELGLQKLIQNLSNEYGKDKAFKDEELFDVITKLSYPEVGVFLKQYISGTDALPVTEDLTKAGLQYYPKKMVKDISLFGGDINKYLGVDYGKKMLKISNAAGLDNFGRDMIGFQQGDLLQSWGGKVLTFENVNEVLGGYASTAKEGKELTIIVIRDGEEVELSTTITPIDIEKKHVILLSENPTEAQLKLRKAWLGDYKIESDF
jgi:predicted metalloprotease with PDZ domain